MNEVEILKYSVSVDHWYLQQEGTAEQPYATESYTSMGSQKGRALNLPLHLPMTYCLHMKLNHLENLAAIGKRMRNQN